MRSFLELRAFLDEAARRDLRRLALLPVGCTEQHGPGLPLESDSLIAQGLARDMARRLPAAHAYPVVPFTTTEPNAAFCGTVSVPSPLFRAYLESVCRGILSHPFDALVILNAHGSVEPSLREVGFGLVMEQFRSGGRPVRPVLVASAFEFEARLREEFGQEPGRHADWREFLLVYHELGATYFTPERMAALERFATEHDFRNQCLPPVLGVPMELRSAQGVQGEPLPTRREALAEQADRLWSRLLDWLEEKIVTALDGFDAEYAHRALPDPARPGEEHGPEHAEPLAHGSAASR